MTDPKYKAMWRAIRTDGCTGAPDFHAAWRSCCNRHDRHYSTHRDQHGEPLTRAEADAALLKCLRARARSPIGKWIIAPLYYAAVRTLAARRWIDTEHLNTTAP
mgnify:CR=1 FL=1